MKRSGFIAKFVHRDERGEVLWESEWLHNALANEGERNVLDTYLRGQNTPSSFHVRLFADVPIETDSLASLSGEPGGLLGYSPQPIARDATAAGWPVLDNQFSAGDFQAESAEVVFRAGGIWPTLTHAVLSTSSDNTGMLVDYVLMSQPRQLRSGQELSVQYLCRLS